MDWATRRQFFIIVLILLFISSIVFYYTYPIIFALPTCSDHKKNGDETGVDCGGSCINLCSFEVKKPIVDWVRSFYVADQVYNAVAYIENTNDAAVKNMPYEFRLYDKNGVFIKRVTGTTIIPPSGKYAIIETGINVGDAVVGSTTFDYGTDPVTWYKVPENLKNLHIKTSNIFLNSNVSVPKLTADLQNSSPTATLRNVNVVAILYDINNNAVNVSNTFISSILPGKSISIYFTWPHPFSSPVVRYELLPIIDLFSTKP